MLTIILPALIGLVAGLLGLLAPISASVGLICIAMLIGITTYIKPLWLRDLFSSFLGGTLNLVLLWRCLSFMTPLLAIVLVRLLIKGL